MKACPSPHDEAGRWKDAMQASRRRDGSAGRACPQCCISAGRCCNPAALACSCIPSLCMRRGSTLTLPKINYASPSPPVAAAGTSQGALAAQQPVLQPHPQPCAAGGGRRGSVPIVSGPVAYLRGSAACLGTTGGQCRRPLRLPLAWKICGFNPVPTTSSPRWQSHAALACPPAAVGGACRTALSPAAVGGPGFQVLLARPYPASCLPLPLQLPGPLRRLPARGALCADPAGVAGPGGRDRLQQLGGGGPGVERR